MKNINNLEVDKINNRDQNLNKYKYKSKDKSKQIDRK